MYIRTHTHFIHPQSLRVLVVHSFLLLCSILIYEYITMYFFPISCQWTFGLFQLLAIVNHAGYEHFHTSALWTHLHSSWVDI